jgi:protein-disulfide isomerase
MKSLVLHAAIALLSASLVACKTGALSNGPSEGGKPAGAGATAVSIPPTQVVATMDGQNITYGDLQADKEVGPKLTQAEVKALTDLYDQRHQAVEEVINRRLLEGEAKAKGKTLDEWFQQDYANTVPDPSDDEAKAFYEEHKAQIPQGQSFEDLKPRIKQAVKQTKLRENLGKLIEQLKAQHHAEVALQPPELPRIEVEAKGPSRGPADAKVTIVEFSDFQCPFCGREFPVVERVMKEYEGKVRLVFRNFPLDFHPFAGKAAEAGACANDQGKFWQLHDQMFGHQDKLAVDDLKGYAKAVGIDAGKFDKCLDSGEKKPMVDADEKAGQSAGVNGTPAFFVNGVFINGAQPYEQFKQAIDRELSKNQKG